MYTIKKRPLTTNTQVILSREELRRSAVKLLGEDAICNAEKVLPDVLEKGWFWEREDFWVFAGGEEEVLMMFLRSMCLSENDLVKEDSSSITARQINASEPGECLFVVCVSQAILSSGRVFIADQC